ncbi:DMT family transporter [Marinobacterium arenosum]|uniref:DMT family transporter n=1 Tax=Marinobacterium arenosum TaxID=2862496 RepID=UPI001C93B320|nr:DMT family transporter [Marinobacterium arenosum]MBY4677342.1 DMT family transporter [Marinobacterium arenosum]
MPQPSAVGGAILWMSGALLSFIAMALSGRELSAELTTWQILLLRSLVGLLLISALIGRRDWSLLKTGRPGLQLVRNLSHYIGQWGWFYGIALIPLAEVFAIEFTVPIWTAFLAPLLLGERLTPVRLLTVMIGFAGILIVLRPGIEVVSPAALAVLVGAIGFAGAYVLTKKLTASEPPLTILFYMCLLQLPMGLIPSLFDWQPLAWHQLPWILLVGVTAMSAHYCIARAMQLADATLVIPLDFLRLPLIALIGFLLYGEPIDGWVLLGALVMVAGNGLNVVSEQRKQARLLAEAVD